MAGLTTVVVVREVHTTSACAIVALCAKHTGMLKTPGGRGSRKWLASAA
jgi:hypothetical protein